MSNDLTITRDTELMVVHVASETAEGEEFVDAYLPADAELVVVDSGRIILPAAAASAFVAEARKRGLTVA